MSFALDTQVVNLPRHTNQVRGLAQFALDFLSGSPGIGAEPDAEVLARVALFNTDAVLAGISALALGEVAPTVLRVDALTYERFDGLPGATLFGSTRIVHPEKAIVANSAAVREWDTNGTVFGRNPTLGASHRKGEFGHNDFYPVAIAAAQMAERDGNFALLGMLLSDEIRGRLAEVFSLKDCKIDHVLHGAIAAAVTYGAMLGANVDQIESAVGMVVAHYVPFRAIRAGKSLSDSKGASAALSTEVAIMCMKRAMLGFRGPKDIFRNPEAIFRLFQGPGQLFQKVGADSANTAKADESPFDLVLTRAGRDFAVMGMHFKLGLYEHQSASALQALINVLTANPALLADGGARIQRLVIAAYEPAFGIIGDPAKRDPKNRQSADHSMVYIVATMLRRAIEAGTIGWVDTMLLPADYSDEALHHPLTRAMMQRIQFVHGGEEYDRGYPEGIPTSLEITDSAGASVQSGLIMFPGGHARNSESANPVDLNAVLARKFQALGEIASEDPAALIAVLNRVGELSVEEIALIHDFSIRNVA